MSWLPDGTVYGVLLNFCAEVEALAPQMQQPPYKASPEAMKLAPWGECLQAGEVVLAGSFTRPVAAKAGDAFDADYGPQVTCNAETGRRCPRDTGHAAALQMRAMPGASLCFAPCIAPRLTRSSPPISTLQATSPF